MENEGYLTDWLASPLEIEARKAAEREKQRLAEEENRLAEQRKLLEEARIEDMLIEYHHKNGWDRRNDRRCYCATCMMRKDELDYYYGEGQYER